MPARLVPPLDAAWLLVESHETPMHVGCLQVFSPPRGAGRGYVLRLLEQMRAPVALVPPYSLKLLHPHAALPRWFEEAAPDMTWHVRHVRLPAPGGDAEMASVISSLAGTALDPARPLWEAYLIEGLAGGHFALFLKIHHSLVDGIGGMRLLQATLSTDWRRRGMRPPWAAHRPRPEPHHVAHGLGHLLRTALTQLRLAPSVARALGALAVAALPRVHPALSAPYAAPHAPFNGLTSIQRRLVTLQLPLARIRRLARRAGVTVNDVFLALCAGALRRYLAEAGALPKRPLVAGIPVSVRPDGDDHVGTAVTFILAALATDVAEPAERLRRIHEATAAAKQHLHAMDPAALTEYTLLLMAPYILELMSGLGGHGPPVFNLAISNVPGPPAPLYYNGARLEAMYPMSILTHGQSLNITTLTYRGKLDVGITACRRAVPQVERLARYMREELAALEPPRAHRARTESAVRRVVAESLRRH